MTRKTVYLNFLEDFRKQYTRKKLFKKLTNSDFRRLQQTSLYAIAMGVTVAPQSSNTNMLQAYNGTIKTHSLSVFEIYPSMAFTCVFCSSVSEVGKRTSNVMYKSPFLLLRCSGIPSPLNFVTCLGFVIPWLANKNYWKFTQSFLYPGKKIREMAQ